MGSITEDAKKRHLFPYDTNQEHWTGEDLKGETPDAVAQSFRTIAIEALGGLQKIPVDSELELYLNHEVGFVRAVVEFYDQLKDLNKPVVFWDVDETLGSSEANFSTSSSTEWRFRLSAAPLFRFLQERYPEVQNGILTSRAYSILPLQMTSVDFLGCLGSAINRELVFSSRDIYELLANSGSSALREDLARNVLSDDFLTIDSLISKPAALAKVLALHQLMSIYQDNTLHLIDDLEIHVPEAWTGRVLSSAVAEAVRSCGRL
jgi:hypothetical protein